MTLITMTTVGYGDMSAKTYMGRVISIIIAFWGVLFVSLFVVTLTNLLLFKGGEEKSFYLLKRLQDKDNLKQQAVNVLTSAYRKRMINKNFPNHKRKQHRAMKNMRKYMIKFETIARNVRGNYK